VSPRAHPVAQELQAARELRLHSLLADAEPCGDLGVAQSVDQPQCAHGGPFGGKLGEGSFDRSNEVCRLQGGLDLDRRLPLTEAPATRHGGALRTVACGVANGEVQVVPHCAGRDPMRPATPDPEKDLLYDFLRILFRAQVAEGKRIEPLPIAAIQRLERVDVPGADTIDPRALVGVGPDVVVPGRERLVGETEL